MHDQCEGSPTNEVVFESVQTKHVSPSLDAVRGEYGRNWLDEADNVECPDGLLFGQCDFAFEDVDDFLQDSDIILEGQGGERVAA